MPAADPRGVTGALQKQKQQKPKPKMPNPETTKKPSKSKLPKPAPIGDPRNPEVPEFVVQPS